VLNRFMDNVFLEASQPKRAGVLPYGSASRPGKDLSLFNIAPLDPVLKDRAYGEHAGQTVSSHRRRINFIVKQITLNRINSQECSILSKFP